MTLNSSMDILLMLAIGALLGWFYSWLVSVHDRQDVIFGTAIGVAGALIGGFVLTRLFGVPPLTGGALAPSTAVVSLASVIGILGGLELFRGGFNP
jgi:uncharacterized membrane protein YeaQ/YmgE (transglycosylase-associated protein family)